MRRFSYKFKKQPFTLVIHVALVIILTGAVITHFLGIQGSLTLPVDGSPVSSFDKTSGPGESEFPFQISLKSLEIEYFPGTTAPMDFSSVLDIEGSQVTISMNNVGKYKGWRFCQSGLDNQSSILTVSYDPYGIAVTYCGYILLGIGLVGFFFQPDTPWRILLKSYRAKSLALLIVFSFCGSLSAAPQTMQRPLAKNLGKVYVYWNDRVVPLQTMAIDVTNALYGSDKYKGFTPEQVLSGWLFYYEEWLRDYRSYYPEIIDVPLHPVSKKDKKTAERMGLIQWLGTGEAFKIFPYVSANGNMEWLSLTGIRPSKMSLEQWEFMQTLMPRMKSLLINGQNRAANSCINELIEGQIKYAGKDKLPTPRKIQGERIYNSLARPSVGAILSVVAALMIWISASEDKRKRGWIYLCASALNLLTTLYVAAIMGMVWWISSHIPLSNGPETMLFMGLVASAGANFVKNREIKGALLLVAGMALAVAAMGARTPRIASLMPVLGSPLLSVHVMLVMTAYVLFLLMAVMSALALISKSKERKYRFSIINRLILTPSVALLATGIFIGAVWANQSWGRYWGWDPKETCALIMMFIYGLPLHWGSRRLKCFRNPTTLHIYLLIAVLSVAFTYFGANYLLPGLHSYA